MFNIFNFFNKKENTFCGLNFEDDFKFQLIELNKKNNSYYPIFFKNTYFNNTFKENIFKKKEFINQFKKYKENIKSDKIKIFLKDNNKLKKEIKLALKIVGFKEILFVKEKNILGVILDNFYPYKKNIFYFTKNRVYFFNIENNKLKHLDEILMKDFSYLKINEFIKEKKLNEIYVSGNIKNNLDSIQKIFYIINIKMKFLNIWKNFLNFSDHIPEINLIDSYNYIDVLSITIPNLKKQPILKEKSIKTEDILLLPKASPKKKINKIINHNKKICYELDIKKENKKKINKKKIIFLPKNNILRKYFNKIKNIFKFKIKKIEKIKEVEKKIEKPKLIKNKPKKKINKK